MEHHTITGHCRRALMGIVLAVVLIASLVSPSPASLSALPRARQQSPAALPAEQAVHYIVFQKLPDGAVKPISYRRVHLDAPLESLSSLQVSSALARDDLQSEQMTVALETAAQDTVYRTVVDVPRWLRGEFQDKPGEDIEGHFFAAESPVFVVRVPAIEGTALVIRDRAGQELGRFDMAQLAEATPRIQLEALDAQIIDLRVTGSSANRVDWLILGDGYTAAQQAKFTGDAQKLVSNFFAISPYAEYANFVNVRALFVPSAQTGADHPPYAVGCSQSSAGHTCCGDAEMRQDPLRGTFANTAFGGTYCLQNLHRLVGVDDTAVASAAAAVPDHDQIIVLINDATYGGSGGGYAVISMSEQSLAVARHEYGHSFARLGDEYDTAYPGFERCSDTGKGYPCEDNVTDVATRDRIKWQAWISPTMPIPTTPQWDASYSTAVGLFEGARYLSTGMYRSGQRCIMRDAYAPFCQVPAQAYVLRLYEGGWGAPWSGISLIEPDSVQPRASVTTLRYPATQVFRADVLQPAGSPPLRISWLVNGVAVPGATGNVFTYAASSGQPDVTSVTMRVQDITALVNPFMANNATTSSHTWVLVSRQVFLPLIVSVYGAP